MTTECANCGRGDTFLWSFDAADERERLCALCWELRGALDIPREAPQSSADVIRS